MTAPRTAAGECPECGAELRMCLHFADAYRYLLGLAQAAASPANSELRAALKRIVALNENDPDCAAVPIARAALAAPVDVHSLPSHDTTLCRICNGEAERLATHTPHETN